MEYIIGALVAIIGILLFIKGPSVDLAVEKKEENDLTSKIESNKKQIQEQKKALNEPVKTEKKSLADLLEYFTRIGK